MANLTDSIIKRKPAKKANSNRHLRLAVFTIIAIGFLGYSAFYFMAPSEKEYVLNYFTYTEVGKRDFAIDVTTSGVIVPKSQGGLRAPAAGVIAELYVADGQDVEEGTVLLQIHSLDLETRYVAAQRRLDQAQQDLQRLLFDQETEIDKNERDIESSRKSLADATQDLELKRLLFSYGGIARIELERAKITAKDAESSLQRLVRQAEESVRRHVIALQRALETVETEQQALADITITREGLIVKAPISGRIVELNNTKGADVANNALLMTIADVENPIIRGNLNADVIDLIELQHPATIKTAFASYEGIVTYIAPRAVDVGGNPVVEIHLQFANPVTELRPNSAVTVDIEVGRRVDSPYLPRGAYLSSGEQLFVYVLRDGVALRQEVRYGMIGSTAVEILNGLLPGNLVITSSYDEFRHYGQVKVNMEGGRRL